LIPESLKKEKQIDFYPILTLKRNTNPPILSPQYERKPSPQFKPLQAKKNNNFPLDFDTRSGEMKFLYRF